MKFDKGLVVVAVTLLYWTVLSPAQPQAPAQQSGAPAGAATASRMPLGKLATGAEVGAFQGPSGDWGIEIGGAELARVRQSQPVEIDLFYEDAVRPGKHAAGYKTVRRTDKGFIGQADVSPRRGVIFAVEDRWTIAGNTLLVDRVVRVTGQGREGFITALVLETDRNFTFSEPQYFVPGAAYGTSEYMADYAPGGPASYGAGQMELREGARRKS